MYIYTIYKNQSIQDYLFIVSLDCYIFIIIKLCDIYTRIFYSFQSSQKPYFKRAKTSVYQSVYERVYIGDKLCIYMCKKLNTYIY